MGQFHILLGHIYKTLVVDIIVLGASDILLCALIIIFGQHSILLDQMHTSLAVDAMILDAAGKQFCVIVIFDLNSIVFDTFVIPLSEVNIILE